VVIYFERTGVGGEKNYFLKTTFSKIDFYFSQNFFKTDIAVLAYRGV
jgi:hypothetical protein